MKKLKLKNFDTVMLPVNINITKKYRTHMKMKSYEFSPDALIPITFDGMFKTMIANTNRKQYVARLLSYNFDLNETDILENFKFSKNELNKDNVTQKGERVDLVGKLGNILINIEMNRTDTLERNLEYLKRISREDIIVGSSLKEYRIRTVQINLNDFSYIGNETVNCFWLRDDKERRLNYKVLINISIPLIRKKLYTCGRESLNELERYVCMMAMENKNAAENLARGDKLMIQYISDAKEVEHPGFCLEDFDWEEHYKNWYREMAKYEVREEERNQTIMKAAKEMHKDGLSFEDISKYLILDEDEQIEVKQSLGI